MNWEKLLFDNLSIALSILTGGFALALVAWIWLEVVQRAKEIGFDLWRWFK